MAYKQRYCKKHPAGKSEMGMRMKYELIINLRQIVKLNIAQQQPK
jgi:hypothetical protein